MWRLLGATVEADRIDRLVAMRKIADDGVHVGAKRTVKQLGSIDVGGVDDGPENTPKVLGDPLRSASEVTRVNSGIHSLLLRAVSTSGGDCQFGIKSVLIRVHGNSL